MANVFPDVLSNTVSSESTTTSHTADASATVDDGDLLLLTTAIEALSDPVSSDPSGWTEFVNEEYTTGIFGAGTLYVWAVRADGTEGGDTIDFSTSVSQDSVSIVTRITAGTWNDTGTLSDAIEVGTVVTGTSFDAGSLSPTWGTNKALFGVPSFAFNSSTPTSFPSGYVDTASGFVGLSSVLSVCYREVEAASEDPGAYSYSGSPSGLVIPIAILGGTVAAAGGLFFGPGL